MKESRKVIVFRERKHGLFLESYKDRGTLAFTANYSGLTDCLKIPRDKYEVDKKVYDALAKAFECEIVAVEIDYKLSHPNGAEVESIDSPEDKLKRVMEEILPILKGE